MPHALRGLASRILLLACAACATASAQQPAFTHADTLRGSITPERAWWDVAFYDLHVRLDPADSTVRGWNGITYRVTGRLARDADRPPDAAGDRQHRAGRPPAHLPARRQRVLRAPCRETAEGGDEDRHRLLPWAADHRHAAPLGRWAHLGARSRRRHLDLDRLPAPRRQRLVAHQGHPGRRARQPARRHHGPRFAAGRRQWPPARRRAPGRRMGHVGVVRRQPDQQLRRGPLRRTLRAVHRHLRRRGAARSRSTSIRWRRTSRPPASSGSR